MNKRTYIIGAVFIAFIALGVYFVNLSKVEYLDIKQARQNQSKAQIIGAANKSSQKFISELGTFTFRLIDKNGDSIQVVYKGAKPGNFDNAEQVVIKGIVINDTLQADEILTKCPSKYDGK